MDVTSVSGDRTRLARQLRQVRERPVAAQVNGLLTTVSIRGTTPSFKVLLHPAQSLMSRRNFSPDRLEQRRDAIGLPGDRERSRSPRWQSAA